MPIKRTKIAVMDLAKLKREGKPVAWVTAYDFPLAHAAEDGGIDMILVGDSGGMVQLGHATTNPVTMEEMLVMSQAARRGAPNTFLIGDMPQGSYEVSNEEAVRNALHFVKEAGCDAVKLEGGRRIAPRIRAIADAGVLVMGHVGLTPQSASSFGGYRVQGKSIESFEETLDEARALEEAGAFAILLEAMPSEPAGQIARQLKVPLYGIGGGNQVDGQLIIMHDLLGFYQPFRPWFAKCYVPEVVEGFVRELKDARDIKKMGREARTDGLLRLAALAVERYVQEVKSRAFPGPEYCYPLKAEELTSLRRSRHWKKK